MIGIMLVVAIVAVFVAGDGNKTSVTAPTAARTPTQRATASTGSSSGKATSTINVRSGPSNGYEALGLLRRGSQAKVIGRSDDGEWLLIEYPANSNLHGWVVASSLETSLDLAALPVATPESLPMAIVPTYPPELTVVPEETAEATATAVTTTPAPALPDLVVSGTLVSGGTLVVTVTNQGTGGVKGAPIEVAVYDVSGEQLLKSASLAAQNLNAGASIDVQTNYIAVVGPTEVLVIVDPNGEVTESDDTNNRLIVSLSPKPTATAPVATHTPHP
jgi:CARDB/Bacterial SH3 domain